MSLGLRKFWTVALTVIIGLHVVWAWLASLSWYVPFAAGVVGSVLAYFPLAVILYLLAIVIPFAVLVISILMVFVCWNSAFNAFDEFDED